jgi:hypothetical protein
MLVGTINRPILSKYYVLIDPMGNMSGPIFFYTSRKNKVEK